MAKVQTNKVVIIIAVVCAAFLLILIGNYTGRAMEVKLEGQPCNSYFLCVPGLQCVNGICRTATTTIGLTTEQKQDVLSMLNGCSIEGAHPGIKCNEVCTLIQKTCVLASPIKESLPDNYNMMGYLLECNDDPGPGSIKSGSETGVEKQCVCCLI